MYREYSTDMDMDMDMDMNIDMIVLLQKNQSQLAAKMADLSRYLRQQQSVWLSMIAGGGADSAQSQSQSQSAGIELQPLGVQQQQQESSRPLLARGDSCASPPYVEYAVVRPNVLGDPRHPDEGCYRQLCERDWLALLDREGRVSNPLHLCKVRLPNYFVLLLLLLYSTLLVQVRAEWEYTYWITSTGLREYWSA